MQRFFTNSSFLSHIDSSVVTDWLDQEESGTYVIRYSSRPEFAGCFVLSRVINTGEVKHLRVKTLPSGKFLVSGGQYFK